AQRLNWAVVEARAATLVGERVLGSGFRCEVEIRRGAGGFVLGEETALLESIEGRRAQPRTRPPFPVEAGLWGRPTVINNVETLSAFNARESCGKCTPCREGLPRLLALLDEGDSEQKIRELGETIQLASLCGLGQAAPIAVQKGFESFGDELRARR